MPKPRDINTDINEGEVRDGELSPGALQRQAAMIVYLDPSDVKALEDPERSLRTVSQNLKSNHWVDQFQAIDVVRSLSLHHANMLTPTLHRIAPLVATCAESLRSSVCKNALLCLFDMCGQYQTDLENSVPSLMTSLLKRSADTSNIFISASANSALVKLIESCPGPKLVQTLFSQSSTRNASLRAIVAKSISFAIDTHGAPLLESSSDKKKVIKLSTTFLSDGKPGTRQAGRRLIWSLSENGALSTKAIQNLSGSDQAAVKKVLDKGVEPEPITVGASSPTRSNFAGSPARRGGSPRTPGSRRRKTPQRRTPQRQSRRRESNGSDNGSIGSAGSDRSSGEPYTSNFQQHGGGSSRSPRSPRTTSPRDTRNTRNTRDTDSQRRRPRPRRTQPPPEVFEEDSLIDGDEGEWVGERTRTMNNPSRSPMQTPTSPRSGGGRRTKRAMTQFEREEERERLQERQKARTFKMEERQAMDEIKEMEERAIGLQKKELHREKTQKMAERGRKRAEERILEEKARTERDRSEKQKVDFEEEKKQKLRTIAQEKAADGRRKETKQRIQEYRRQKQEMVKKEEERKKVMKRAVDEDRRGRKQRGRGENIDRPWRKPGETTMAGMNGGRSPRSPRSQGSRSPRHGSGNGGSTGERSDVDAKPLTQHELQQEIWRQRQKMRRKESQAAVERERRRKQRETNVLNANDEGDEKRDRNRGVSKINTPNTGISRREQQQQQRRAVAPAPPKMTASPPQRDDVPRLPLPSRVIGESDWDNEIRRAQGIRAANRGQHSNGQMGKPHRQEPPSPRSGRRQRMDEASQKCKHGEPLRSGVVVGGGEQRRRRDNSANNDGSENSSAVVGINSGLTWNDNGGLKVSSGNINRAPRNSERKKERQNNNNNGNGNGNVGHSGRGKRPAPLHLDSRNIGGDMKTSSKDVFGYHPNIPERGGTALMEELNQLGLSGLQKQNMRGSRNVGGGSGGDDFKRRNNSGKANNMNKAWSPRNGRTNQKKTRNLLEIKEIASYQYGAHGNLVPVGTDDATALYGPMSPLSRHIHMEEMRSTQMGPVNNLSPAPIVSGVQQRLLARGGHAVGSATGFGELRAMDVAERNLLNDISSLDYALEANKRKRLRSTRSEPNHPPRRDLFAAASPRGNQPLRRARSQRAPQRSNQNGYQQHPKQQQQQQRRRRQNGIRSPRNGAGGGHQRHPQQPQRKRDVGRSPRQPKAVDRMVVVPSPRGGPNQFVQHNYVQPKQQQQQQQWQWKQNNQPLVAQQQQQVQQQQPWGQNYFQQQYV
jgi:hypothetical protein